MQGVKEEVARLVGHRNALRQMGRDQSYKPSSWDKKLRGPPFAEDLAAVGEPSVLLGPRAAKSILGNIGAVM